ncbi:DUF423 domain-containing protein [Gilvimarinus polysaccharolyticus]|uniref:DUF423 domain-containing protein n=1 Tax=Gilvimarinus polysaccharolyticus TaxID=863921 RepID=UPI0006733D40|nr:DUF423 domain-containing protein [Gilvimarinus polysaccharolyticus]
MPQLALIAATAYGFIAVALGAFAAHSLKDTLTPELLGAFQTGVQYQMYHALALLMVGLWLQHCRQRAEHQSTNVWLNRACGLFIIGTLLFSGSLYGLTLTGFRLFGPITPLGGVCLLLGWLCLLLAALKSSKDFTPKT